MFTQLIERSAHLYPFFSGAGRFANMALFRSLDPPGGADHVVQVVGGKALVPAGDHVGRAMRFVGDLDPKVSWIVDRALGAGDIALDIGANLGLVSLRMMARVGPNGHVHAFEPQPRMLGYLERTLAMNPGCPMTLHPMALGAENADLAMRVPDGNAGAASLTKPFTEQTGVRKITVPVRCLDEYAEEIGLTRIDFIKMDVEGFEASVLQGAARILEQTRPHVIILEENSPEPDSGLSPALRALQQLDYELFALPQQFLSVKLSPISEKRFAHDFVAVSASAPDRILMGLGLRNGSRTPRTA